MGPTRRLEVKDQAGERLLELMRELDSREAKQVENEADGQREPVALPVSSNGDER